jgi:small multidrug resistance pump
MNKYLMMLTHAALLASLLAFSHGVLKWVSSQAHTDYLQLILSQWKLVMLALSIYGLVFFYYILVLRSSPITSLYPVYTGLSVLFVMLVGRLVFHETVSPYQILGAGFILAGIVLTGYNS